MLAVELDVVEVLAGVVPVLRELELQLLVLFIAKGGAKPFLFDGIVVFVEGERLLLGLAVEFVLFLDELGDVATFPAGWGGRYL